MDDLLNNSLGIYWAIYRLCHYQETHYQWLIIGWGGLAVGLASFAPRYGQSIHTLRFLGYLFLAWWIVAGVVFTGQRHALAMMMWCVLIGMMIRFSYEVLYNNHQV